MPIYNVAPYVERCILSLEDQDIPEEEYELICVNDGSTDNCREIIENLQKEFSNIVLINQENQGVSRARNNGIDKATGRYLLFVDSDDYVDPNSFARVLDYADRYNAQVTFLGFSDRNEEGKISNSIYYLKDKGLVRTGIEAYSMTRINRQSNPDRIWAILFKRRFINENNLKFLPTVHYLEDGEILARILCLAERCVFEGYSFYQFTTRIGSATNSDLFQSEKAIQGFIKAAINLKQFQITTELTYEQKVFINQPVCKYTLLPLLSSLNNKVRFNNVYKKLKDLGLTKCQTKGIYKTHMIDAHLYNISPILFYLYRKLVWPLIFKIKDMISHV